MLITELSLEECVDLLRSTHLGRLACSNEGQPYVVPIFFAYDHGCLYCASSEGQKIVWMRSNPLVCLQVDKGPSAQEWMSVVVYGRYEELPDRPEYRDLRKLAWSLLQRQPLWWEPGFARTILAGKERSLTPLYFRIGIERITGHRAQRSNHGSK